MGGCTGRVTELSDTATPGVSGQRIQRRLARSLDSWIRARLWAQVVAALILGAGVGFLLGPEAELVSRATSALVAEWLALPGRVFLGLIKMVLIPLVASSIIVGLANGANDPAMLRQVGLRFGLFVLATTSVAAVLGASLALNLQPGSFVAAEVVAPAATAVVEPPFGDQPVDADQAPLRRVVQQAPGAIAKLIPANPLDAAARSEMLSVVIFAMFIGAAYVSSSNKRRLAPMLNLVEALLEVSMTVVKWAMYLTPLAVFGLTAQLLAQLGVASLGALGAYAGTVLAGLALLMALYLLLVGLFGKTSPLAFQRAAGEAQLLAFSTSSSAAVMPLSIRTAVERLQVHPPIASFLIPLAATVNMAGTALYQAVAVVFVAQVGGVALEPNQIAIIVITLVTASIGAPGTPGVSIAILSGLVASFGIPPQGLVLVLGIDRLLDMSRTAVNVTGDLVAARLFGQAPVAAVDTPSNPPSDSK